MRKSFVSRICYVLLRDSKKLFFTMPTTSELPVRNAIPHHFRGLEPKAPEVRSGNGAATAAALP